MRLFKSLLAVITACTLSLSVAFAAAKSSPASVPSPVGQWQTIDDVTKKPRSIITISVDGQGVMSGKITKAYYRPGEGPNDLCVKCKGELHNQKILGLTILTGMKRSPTTSARTVRCCPSTLKLPSAG